MTNFSLVGFALSRLRMYSFDGTSLQDAEFTLNTREPYHKAYLLARCRGQGGTRIRQRLGTNGRACCGVRKLHARSQSRYWWSGKRGRSYGPGARQVNRARTTATARRAWRIPSLRANRLARTGRPEVTLRSKACLANGTPLTVSGRAHMPLARNMLASHQRLLGNSELSLAAAATVSSGKGFDSRP